MKISRVMVKGFRSIREMNLDLAPLNVLIGANGAGKSNFISLFSFLSAIVNGELQSYVAKAGGANSVLHFGQKSTEQLEIDLQFPPNGYHCILKPAADDSFYFESEGATFHGEGYPQPYTDSYGSGHKESRLSQAAVGKGKGIPKHVLGAFQQWKIYHFHDTSESAGMKKVWDIHDNQYFRTDASNLAAFLYFLKERHAQHYENIRDNVRQVAPFFNDFSLRPDRTNPSKIRLEWREKESDYPFLAHHLSDGTLRFICLSTLLLQPNPPETVLIDEPELGLHPYAITVLASMFKAAATSTQVIVSTQSVPLVNQFGPQDVVVVDKTGRESTFRRLVQDEMQEWLEDYGLGDLWEKNLLGGRP